MKFIKIYSVLILLALLASWAPLASAQTDAPSMKVTPAYNGYFKYGEWLPVLVELENQGRDLEAEVRVQVNSSQGVIAFSVPVSLPSGSRKLVPVFVLPNNFSRELNILLNSQGKTILAEKVTVRPQPNISYLIGLIAPERGALALLSGISLPGQERPKIVADVPLEQIPERAEALNSFDLLVINNVDTSKLTPEQAEALAGWVGQGGRLVIGGGATAQTTVAGLPDALLPLDVQGTVEVGKETLAGLAEFAGSTPNLLSGPFIAARGTLADDAVVLAGDKDFPIVLERGYGSGQIDFVTFDLSTVPFNGWPGTQDFWEILVSPGAAYPENMPFDVSPRQYRANSLTYALSNIPSLDLPSVQGLSILLGVYILIVGPANYLFLRWRKRLHLAWMTIPALTALFAGAAFGIGYGMRGNDLVLNKIAIVETRADGAASVTSYMGLFSPRQQSYAVDVYGEGLIRPMMGYDMGPWGSGVPSATGGEMVFYQGQPARVQGLTVNQWAMQSFMAEGVWQDFGGITGELVLENDTLVGKVRNETGQTLTDVVLAVRSRFVRLGDLKAGEEAVVDLGLGNLQNDRFSSPLSYRLFQERFTSGPMPRDMELKSNIVSTLFENMSWGKGLGGIGLAGGGGTGPVSYQEVLVFGWMNQAPPDVEVPDSRLSQQTTAIVYSTLDFQLPSTGVIILPPGMIPGSVVKMPPESGICGPAGTPSIHMGKGQAEFEFQIPANLQDYEVDNLKLSFWRDTGGQWGMPTVALYHWENENWTVIQDPIQGTNVIQKAAPYINENGKVWIQVTSETDAFGCIYLDLGLEAQRAAAEGG